MATGCSSSGSSSKRRESDEDEEKPTSLAWTKLFGINLGPTWTNLVPTVSHVDQLGPT